MINSINPNLPIRNSLFTYGQFLRKICASLLLKPIFPPIANIYAIFHRSTLNINKLHLKLLGKHPFLNEVYLNHDA